MQKTLLDFFEINTENEKQKDTLSDK